MANDNLPPDVQRAALDLLIAVKRSGDVMPAQQNQNHFGGHEWLNVLTETLIATIHAIGAASLTASQEVQDAVRTLSEQGRAAHERTSLDELIELRRKVVG